MAERPQRSIVCFDLDDTLRDSRSRHPLSPRVLGGDWPSYNLAASLDEPVLPAATTLRLLAPHYDIHIVTANCPVAHPLVEQWLDHHRLPWTEIACISPDVYPPGVHAGTLKRDHIRRLQIAGRHIAALYDDLPSVVDALRPTGVPGILVPSLTCEGPCSHCAGR